MHVLCAPPFRTNEDLQNPSLPVGAACVRMTLTMDRAAAARPAAATTNRAPCMHAGEAGVRAMHGHGRSALGAPVVVRSRRACEGGADPRRMRGRKRPAHARAGAAPSSGPRPLLTTRSSGQNLRNTCHLAAPNLSIYIVLLSSRVAPLRW